VPVDPWLRFKLKDFAREALLDRDSACRNYLDRSTLKRIIEEHETGRISRHQEIWTLLIFEFWHRVLITARGKGIEGRAVSAESAI